MSTAGAVDRRRLLAGLFLPALLVALAWIVAGRMPLLAELERTRTRLAEARAQNPADGALLPEIAGLSARIAGLKVQAPPPAAGPRPASATERAARREALSAVLFRHGLRLDAEESSTLDLGPAAAAALGGEGGRSRVPVTTLRFRGRWDDVRAALAALRETDPGLLPLRLEMDADRVTGGAPAWTLVLAGVAA